jgi:hypothetical protein
MVTVRIESMLLGPSGQVLRDWTVQEGSVINNSQEIARRMYHIKRAQNATPYTIRVRAVSEQTGQVVDMLP